MPLRDFGIFLLVVGVILLVLGTNASESINSSMAEACTGKPTDKTAWLLSGAALAIVVGAGWSFTRGRGEL